MGLIIVRVNKKSLGGWIQGLLCHHTFPTWGVRLSQAMGHLGKQVPFADDLVGIPEMQRAFYF